MKRSKINQLLASVLVNAIYAMKNYPVITLNTFLAPFSLLIVIDLISRGSLITASILGGFLMQMTSSGLSLQGDLVHFKVDFKLQDMVVTSPTSALIYYLGMALSELIYVLPSLLVLLLLALIYIKVTFIGIISIISVLAMMFALSTSMGFMISSWASDITESWGFSGILSTVLSTLPPVYYPISYIPYPFRLMAYISPTTYAAELLQSQIGVIRLSGAMAAIDWAVLAGITIILAIISIKRTRWRDS